MALRQPSDRLTWRILTEDTQKIIICSGIQSALRTTTNQRLASPSGEGTTLPFPTPYPQQSTNSLPLDPLDESTPNFEHFVNSQSGEDEDNPIHMANIDIPNLLGRSFLLPPEDNREPHMAKIIDIDDHGQPLEDIKLKLKINDRIPSTTPGAEPPRDAKDSGSARPHSTHLETSSTNRP